MIDFGALFSQLFTTFWWLLPLFVLITLLKSAWFKGDIGEVIVCFSTRGNQLNNSCQAPATHTPLPQNSLDPWVTSEWTSEYHKA